MDVRQRGGGGGMDKRDRPDCRGCQARFLNCQQICHGSHGADEKPSKRKYAMGRKIFLEIKSALIIRGTQLMPARVLAVQH